MSIEFVKDERDKRVEQQREQMRGRMGRRRIDRTAMAEMDEAYRAKWINNDQRAINTAKARDFVMVERDKGIVPKHAVWDSEKSAYVLGDLVLMKEPIEVYEEKRAAIREEGDFQAQQYQNDARETINKAARDAGISRAHEDIVQDDSKQGPDVAMRLKRK